MSINKRLLRIELVRCLDCPYFKHYTTTAGNDGFCQVQHRFQFTISNMNIIDPHCPLDILHPERTPSLEEIREQQIMKSPQYMSVIED